MKIKRPYWPLLLGPTFLYYLGSFFNVGVMAINHGQMPVLVPGNDCSLIEPEDFIHTCMTAGTHLKFLADWIVINHFGVASPGDFLEWACDQTFWPALFAWVMFVIRDHDERTL